MRLIDMHCDTISELFHGDKEQNLLSNTLCVDVERMKKAGTWIQYFACFVNAGTYEKRLRAGKRLPESREISSEAWEEAWKETVLLTERLSKESSEEVQMIQICREAEENPDGINALATVEEGGVLNDRIDRLDELYDKGIRLLTLTWNYENCIGYPNSRNPEIMKKGLKSFGMDVIDRMNEKGMLIDVSHLSDGGFWDCTQRSKVPVVASHSNARALCSHPRNLSDEMLRALADKGGVAGINFYPAFLREDSHVTNADIARHINYMIKTAGEDVVAIGTDFDGFEADVGEEYISHVGQMELVWEACKKTGITERQLDKICWQNAWRVMNEVM